MSSSSSLVVKNAIERAESRGAILISLEKSYGAGNIAQLNKTTKKTVTTTQNNVSAGNGTQAFTFIQNFIGDQRDKARKTLTDSLLGKSIILSNLKSQTDAAKAAKKIKRCVGQYYRL